MLNRRIIAAAHRRSFTLEVMAQITGVPARLIAASVKPHPSKTDLYSLKHVQAFFESETGQRLLRKLWKFITIVRRLGGTPSVLCAKPRSA